MNPTHRAGTMVKGVPIVVIAMGVTLLTFMVAPFLILQTQALSGKERREKSYSVRPVSLPGPSNASKTDAPKENPRPAAPSSPMPEILKPPSLSNPAPLKTLSAIPLSSLRSRLKPQLDIQAGANPGFGPVNASGLKLSGESSGSGGTGTVDQMPQIEKQVPMLYPESARQQGIQGSVSVRFLVGINGHVDRVEILHSQPPGVFDDTVRRSIGEYRFKPAIKDGGPVPVWMNTTVNFNLDESG